MNPNSLNMSKGMDFQGRVSSVLEDHFGQVFEAGQTFSIGYPAKEYKFSLISSDSKIIVQTKNHTWTESGNVPSAKIAVLNQSVFFLRLVPSGHTKAIVMNLARTPKKRETLAEYYVKTNRHLFGDVMIMEYDPNSHQLTVLYDGTSGGHHHA